MVNILFVLFAIYSMSSGDESTKSTIAPIPIKETKARLVKDFKFFFQQVRDSEGCTVSPKQLRKFLEVSGVPRSVVDEKKVSDLVARLNKVADGLIAFKEGYELLLRLLFALTDTDQTGTVSRPEFTNMFSLFPADTDEEPQREIGAIFDYLSKGTDDIDFGEFKSQMAQIQAQLHVDFADYFADYCKPKPIPIEKTKARLVKDFIEFFEKVRGGEGCTVSPKQLKKFLEDSGVPSDMVDEKVSDLLSLLDEAADGLIEFEEGYGLLFALTDIDQTRTVSRPEFENLYSRFPHLQSEIDATFDYLSKGTDVIDFEEFKSQMRKLDFGDYCKGQSSSSGQSIMTPMFAYTSARSGTNTAEFYAFEILAFVLCVLLCISLYFNVKSMCGMNSKNYGFKKVAMDDSDRESQAFV